MFVPEWHKNIKYSKLFVIYTFGICTTKPLNKKNWQIITVWYCGHCVKVFLIDSLLHLDSWLCFAISSDVSRPLCPCIGQISYVLNYYSTSNQSHLISVNTHQALPVCVCMCQSCKALDKSVSHQLWYPLTSADTKTFSQNPLLAGSWPLYLLTRDLRGWMTEMLLGRAKSSLVLH